jgi:hypothetical protein
MYGVLPVETPDWSPGELLAVVEAGRRRDQRTAVLLHTHAALCARAFNGDIPPVYEAFPMWTDEEIFTMKADRLRKKLLSQSR